MMNVNPMTLLAMIKQGKNPQELMLSVLQSQANMNPLMSNLLTLAQSNNTQGIQQIARNLAKERGLDFDTEFAKFKKQMGM